MNAGVARTLATLSGGAAGLAAALTGLVVLKEAGRIDVRLVGVLGWAIGPYAFFVLLAWAARRSAAAEGVILAGVLASAGFGAWAIHDAFFKPPRDALAGLVFLVVPIYQGAALLASALVAGAILWASCRRRRPA